jgi:hypothetical protein
MGEPVAAGAFGQRFPYGKLFSLSTHCAIHQTKPEQFENHSSNYLQNDVGRQKLFSIFIFNAS